MAETHTAGHGLKKYDTGDNPGAANLNFNWDTIDKRLVGIGTAFPAVYPVTGLFFRRDQKRIYENQGTQASPVWVDLTPSAGISIVTNVFTPSDGQTVFTLSQPYAPGGFILLTVNGIDYRIAEDFTVSGTTLTWTNTLFSLDANDDLVVHFEPA